MIKRALILSSGFVVSLLLILFWLAFFSSRPPLTTDPAVLAGDGSRLDYCRLPVLDGSRKRASDIAKGNTPGCGYKHFPDPILQACSEPLPPEADDIRGLWIGVEGKVGYVERVEQCGNRTVITAAGIIHDYGPNSTAGLNTNDTEGGVSFSIGDKDYCPRTSATMIWKDKVLNFHVFGRNVSPEWVEAMMSNDFRIGRAVLAHGRDGKFCALINPTLLGEALYDNDQYEQNLESLRALCAEAPAYARPDDFICINAEAASEAQLFTASGRPRRRVINEYVMSKLKETQNV